MRPVAALALVAAACSPAPAPTSLFGEVHIHQFADGAHLSALFVRAPVPADAVAGDEILPAAPPSQTLGACVLTALDPATLPPPPALADDGDVHLRGGDRDLALVWHAPAGYLPPPLPAGAPAFAAGVRVDVSGDGAALPAFAGSVTTPAPLVLSAPDALAVGDVAALVVAWTPAPGDARITIDLIASRSDGAAALVECRVADADATAAIPRALLDALPPRPRDLQLEVSRDEIVRAPSRRSAEGVLLHAGFEAALAAHEP